MTTTCDAPNDKEKGGIEASFLSFSQALLQTFILVVIIIFVTQIARVALEKQSLFYLVLLAVIATFLFSIINILSPSTYQNIMLGLGLGVGLMFANPGMAS